jgi:cupin fold WbuC family metalloprotein
VTTRLITPGDLAALSREAAAKPRRRLNLNLHVDSADPCQRLFNAVEPGSYIRPHRHSDPPKAEAFVAVCGRFTLLLFDDAGEVIQRIDLAPGGPVVAVDIPAGTWHSVVAREPGSIFFETKQGPYVKVTDKDFARWAPEEGSPEAEAYLQKVLSDEC